MPDQLNRLSEPRDRLCYDESRSRAKAAVAGGMNMRRHFTVGFFCIGIILCCLPLRATEDEFASHLQAGMQAARQRRYSSAKAEFQAAITLDPNRAQAWYELGLLYGQMTDFPSAEQAFRQALKLDPNSAKVHCRLGQTLIANPRSKQDWQGAVTEFRKALAIEPNYPEAESFLGLGLSNLGQTDAAIATLKHAIQLDPKLAATHLNLAVALEAGNRLQEAVEEYKAAIEEKSNAPDTEAALGSLLLRMGEPILAEQEFRKALRLNPDLVNAHYGLARLLKTQKKEGQAAIEFDEARELEMREDHGIQAVRLSNESLQLAAKGDLTGSIDLLRKAVLLKPDYGAAHYNLGLVLADSAEFSSARDELIKAVSLLPGEARAWFDLGRVLLKLGDKPNALQVISWAAWLAPENASFAAELESLRTSSATPAFAGKTLPKTGDNAAVESEPSQPHFGALSDTESAHLAFAADLRIHGDALGAVGELLRVLTLHPDSVAARQSLADAYLSLFNWDRAILEYHKILLVSGDNADTHLALGKALMAKGHPAEAVDEFRLVLKIIPDSTAARSSLEAALQASPSH
jgi:tetratricopeptide (TPR) repeat protein